MNRPISLIIRDTKIRIVQAINESQLPPSIVELILNNIYQQAVKAAEAEIKQAEEGEQNAESN